MFTTHELAKILLDRKDLPIMIGHTETRFYSEYTSEEDDVEDYMTKILFKGDKAVLTFEGFYSTYGADEVLSKRS